MAKQKKKHWFRWYYLIPIALIIVIACLVYVLFGNSTSSDHPVYGRRCEVVQEITDDQIAAADSAIQGYEGLVSSSVELNCLTLDMTLTFNDTITIEQAETTATELTHVIDSALGFEKYNETDAYSKVFSDNQFDRMYDIKITIYNSAGTYTIYGTKHYQDEEVYYTTSNVKDQDLVDSLHASQAAGADTTGETTTDTTVVTEALATTDTAQ